MSHIDIHPRIEQRHPEIKPQDVYDAVRGMVSYTRRESGEWVGVGFDTPRKIHRARLCLR